MWAPGTAHRNHCPTCCAVGTSTATSPADRASSCGGRMDPISISVRGGGEWLIVHRCGACGAMGCEPHGR
ncbi:RNHCP domain-containing protein [Rhodococcus hoagii]|nr:RNHCP domain-containing protein [Prescottella equi]